MTEDERLRSEKPAFVPPWEHRGTDLTRILSLSDGIFGFAMTLLVLAIVLPATSVTPTPPLFSLLTQGTLPSAFESYALVFVVLASYWRSHNLLFSYVHTWDRAVIQLNMLFLALIVLQPFLVHVITGFGGQFEAVFLYAGISGLTGLTLSAIWAHVSRDARLRDPQLDEEGVRWLRISLYLTPAVFGISIVIGLVNPTLGELSWFGVFAAQFVHIRSAKSRHAAPGPPPAGTP